MKKNRKTLPKFTDRLPLGNTGLKVSPFCIGMVATEDAIVEAFKLGINFFFFTADMHWPYYEKTRQGIKKILARNKGAREKLVIATVAYVTQPEFCRMPFKEALDEVSGLTTIDLVVAGGVYSNEFLTRLPVYEELKQNNFLGARAIGATFHDRVAGRLAVNHNLVDIAYIRYNPAHSGARNDIFPHLIPNPKTLIYNFKSTLSHISPERCQELGIPKDAWMPKVTDYYRFALKRPEIDGLLCSPITPQQVHALAKALEEGPLSGKQEQFLMDIAKLDAHNMTVTGKILPLREKMYEENSGLAAK